MNAIFGVVAALILSMLSLPTLLKYQQVGIDNTKMSVTAQQWKQVSDATQQYVQANAAAIEAVATTTTPATITVAMLQTTGFLPTSFSNTNPYGQTWTAETLQPAAGQLQTIVFSRGAATIPAIHIAKIATLATSPTGAQGGFVPYANQFGPTTVTTSAQGSNWTLPLAGYVQDGPGHLAALLYYNINTQTNTYLNRNAFPGNPALNTMNTAINMGGNSITSLTPISAAQLADSPVGTGNCANNGDLGSGPNGEVVSCVSSKWKAAGSSYWGDPASVGTNTPTQAQLDTALGVCTNTAPPKGRVHMVTGASGQPRPYVCDGVDWQPVAVDLAGNLTATGLIKSSMWQPTTVVTENTSDANCVVADPTTWGRTAKDANGLILSCQSGVWIQNGIKSGGGARQLWLALAGQTISCFGNEFYNTTFYATVDQNGNLFSKIVVWNSPIGISDTGWVAGGFAANLSTGLTYLNMTASLGGVVGQVFSLHGYQEQHITCTAGWN